MNRTFILLLMIFCHIFDDYTLQGWLASAKQKSWWKENAPDKLYKHDYIMALIMHSLSWSFMIMLPIAIHKMFQVDLYFVIFFVLNTIAHGLIDNAKANKKTINLIEDQFVHIFQIVMTFVALIIA